MAVFSIIVPVYNVENEIRECLDSIKNQTFADFEVLCVDDCGSDSSMDIVREYASEDSRFKILTHEHNKGVSAARNTALDAVQGEYIMFVDSDDWLELNALETVNNIFNKVKTDVVMFNLYYSYPNKPKEEYKSKIELADNIHIKLDDMSLESFVGVVWNRAYRTSLINDNNIRFPVGLIIEDSEFSFKVSTYINTFYTTKTPLYNYRQNRDGSYTTDDIFNERIADEIEIYKRCYRFAKERGIVKKYRKYFLKLIGTVTKKILIIKHRRRYILEKVRDLLIEMDFPNAYKDMEKRVLTLWMDK